MYTTPPRALLLNYTVLLHLFILFCNASDCIAGGDLLQHGIVHCLSEECLEFRGVFITQVMLQNVLSVANCFATKFTTNGKSLEMKTRVSIGQIQLGPSPFRSVCSVWFLNGFRCKT
jgi:hypothetical protein